MSGRKASRSCVSRDQAADVVRVGIDQRVIDDFAERDVGQGPLGGHPFALTAGRDAGQLVARLLLVGLGQQFGQIGEVEPLAANRAVIGHCLRTSTARDAKAASDSAA